jgi:formyltetrahydrofolate synthetase
MRCKSFKLDENVSNHFAIKTSNANKNIKVIRRITTKTGVYVDVLSDYGEYLGKIRHSSSLRSSKSE